MITSHWKRFGKLVSICSTRSSSRIPFNKRLFTNPIDTPKRNMLDAAQKWKPEPEFKFSFYTELSKAKLASFVVLSAMAGYAMAPGIFDPNCFAWTTLGTGLCVMSANSLNQWIEIPYDSQMSRTRNRVLVRHGMNPTHAFLTGSVTGLAGTSILWYFVNPYTALLGCGNILLYSCVYTPMKRMSIYNTWPGAVVGAIPPLMGWVACTQSFDFGGCLMALVLYSWQFPHFNALSWNLRADYSKAGYRMMSVLDPKFNAQVSLFHAMALFPISFGFYYTGMVDLSFLIDSSLLNGYFGWTAYEFWKSSNASTARRLFFASLLQLPIYLLLLLLHKQYHNSKNKDT